MQEKLASVFSENFQVKRVRKEIQQIQQNKDKYSYDIQMSFTRGQNITFHVIFLKGAFKKCKKLSNYQNFEVKIILKRQYPAQPPLIYCMSDSMIDFGLQPFRDYLEHACSQWSAKFTILDVIKIFPEFIEDWKKQSQEEEKRGKYKENESFQVDRIFSWSFLQTFPVKFVCSEKSERGGLLVISNQKEMIFLQQAQQSRESYLTRDIVIMQNLVSIFKSLQRAGEIMLQIKPPTKQTKQKLSLRFRSDDSDNIVNYIIEYMKIARITTTSKSCSDHINNKQQQSSSEQQQDQYDSLSQQQQIANKQSSSPSKINIQAIKQQIVIYQSQVENCMTSENVSNLVVLLKKAIEYYSAIGNEEYEIYLEKLKILLGNQMAQVLLDSAADKRKGHLNDQDKQSQQKSSTAQTTTVYPSIFDSF